MVLRSIVYYKNKKEAGDFDLVAMNIKEVITVEVETTLTVERVKKFISSLKKFKGHFREYKDRRIHGGVAYLSESKGEEAKSAEEYAKENGLFVVISPGGESNVTTISNSQDFHSRPSSESLKPPFGGRDRRRLMVREQAAKAYL